MRRAAAVLALFCAGCLMVGRAEPPPPPLPAPAAAPRVQYALGDVTFQMNQREPTRSPFDARLLGAEIFDHWERRGYVSAAERVDANEFSPDAACHLTFSGNVRAETSFWAELVNALTLLIVPYAVTNHYDLRLVAQPPAGGAPTVASARSADQTWIGLLLLVGLPFVERGHDQEMARLADALYVQLTAQGAFERVAPDEGRTARDEGQRTRDEGPETNE